MNRNRSPDPQRIALRPLALGALLFLLGAMVGIGVRDFPMKSRTPMGGSLRQLLLMTVGPDTVNLYVAVLAVPFFVWAARRWPVARPVSRRNFLVQTLLILLVAGLGVVAFYLVVDGRNPGMRVMPVFFATYRAAATLPVIAGVAILGQAIELGTRAQRSALDAERLRARLADARLATLTAQLRPHFLFNTLQNVSTLMYERPADADALLAHLGELLRASFRFADTRTIPLHEELRLVRDYIEIARVRHGERLSFELDVEDAALAEAVPPFLLQPIVENAIEHGLDDELAGVHIAIRARLAAGALAVAVSDSGRGPNAGAGDNSGIGLRNTRERLVETFGAAASLTLRPLPGGGTIVELRIPPRNADGGSR